MDSGIECRLVLQHGDFIMQNHRVHGVSVMPGVTFLDIVLRVLVAQGESTAGTEIQRVLFTQPVVTDEGRDRELRLTIASPLRGVRNLKVESRVEFEKRGWFV